MSDGHDSRNGKILRKEIIQEFELKIVNETVKCQGKYTRVNTAIEEEKSVIDYVIVNQSSYENVENMIIDEENNYKLSGKKPTDHNTIVVTFNLKVRKIPKDTNRKNKTINPKNVDWTAFCSFVDKLNTETMRMPISYKEFITKIWDITEKVSKKQRNTPSNHIIKTKEIQKLRKERRLCKREYLLANRKISHKK